MTVYVVRCFCCETWLGAFETKTAAEDAVEKHGNAYWDVIELRVAKTSRGTKTGCLCRDTGDRKPVMAAPARRKR